MSMCVMERKREKLNQYKLSIPQISMWHRDLRFIGKLGAAEESRVLDELVIFSESFDKHFASVSDDQTPRSQ